VAGTTNERIAAAIREHLDVEIGTADFLPIDDLRSSIQADVHRLRDSPFVPGEIPVTGVLCTTATGQVAVIDADALSRLAPRLGPDPSAAGTGGR
jgi:carbonic anhydrase